MAIIQQRRQLYDQLHLQYPDMISEAKDAWAVILANQKHADRDLSRAPVSVLAVQSYHNRNKTFKQREPQHSNTERTRHSRSHSRSSRKRSRSHRRSRSRSRSRSCIRSPRISRSLRRRSQSPHLRDNVYPSPPQRRGGPARFSTCAVCKDAEADHIVLPCLHLCLCLPCKGNYERQLFDTCPMCSAVKTSIQRVFTT